MAHFAQLDADNVVQRVIVINNEDCQDASGNEKEEVGVAYCKELFGTDTNWKQCSYNVSFRKNFPSFLYVYDEDRDAFIAPMPFESWSIDGTTCQWNAPKPYPEDGNYYVWDETNLDWEYKGAIV